MILGSPILRKLLGVTLLTVVATLLLLDYYLSRYIAESHIDSVKQQLTLQSDLLLGELPSVSPEALVKWAAEADSRTRARITLIDPRGSVVAESQHDPDTMENHANRPEVQQALHNRTGTSMRHSATLDRDLLYFATSFPYRGQTGYVLRLALPIADINAEIRSLRWRILGASSAAALVGFVIAYILAHSLTRRITRLREFAESLAGARFPDTRLPGGNDELGALARSLQQMSDQLRGMIMTLSSESERREAILSSMVEGVLTVDNDLRVTFYNDCFRRLTGLPAKVVDPVPLVELVRDSGLTEMLRQVLASRQPINQRLQLPSADGRIFEVHAGPLGGPAQPGAVAILHDVTSLERLERIRKDFVANVSHELRTPLTAICGYAETLLEGALDDKENNRRFVEIIKSHADRLNSIASDLLTLSELESPRPPTEPDSISIRAALDAALRTIEPEANSRGIGLVRETIEDAEVSGDRRQLEQAVLNLLQNAVKFNRPGGEVRLSASPTPGGKLCISVADSGVGIPSEDLSRIFERFYRVDKARSREVGGTGLGLSIVKHIVERMNGTVTVESQLGKGSIFRVFLPVHPAPQ